MKFATVSHTALAVALGLVWNAPALADETGEDPAIVVTSQSLEDTLPQELSRYGNDVVTVSGKQIEDSGAVDVVKALETVPGLYIRGRNGRFTYVDVSLQGSRTQDVLWTMDGIRLNNRLYGATSPNDTLPASMIERIEVLRGGERLFYGTQASAGVINVVTRSFTDDFDGQANARWTRGAAPVLTAIFAAQRAGIASWPMPRITNPKATCLTAPTSPA